MTRSSARTPRLAIVVTVACSVVLSGCGTDDGAATAAAPTAVASPDASPDVSSDASAGPGVAPTAPGSSEPSVAPSATPPIEPSPAAEEAEELVIRIVDFAYEVPATVPAGATVIVVNDDSEVHTVTSSGSEAFAVSVYGGETATFTAPAEPGEYRVVCLFHGNMTATLVVV